MEKKFVYEVKQIDEFFERFNDDSSSFIRKIYKSYRVKFNIDRQNLIKSLFNYQTKSWGQSSIDSFVNTAITTQLPSKNNFYGENWFAEVSCRFNYNSIEIEIPVILRIITDERKRSKWVICGVGTSPVKFQSHISDKSSQNNNLRFINPASHANYFIELEKVFEDKENLSAYFDNSVFTRTNTSAFYHAILQNKIKFVSVRAIKYHFLQVTNYIFTVEYFERNDLNSGWLINNIKSSSAIDKELFTKNLLGE